MAEKLVLAYSGGLDTSCAVKWLKDKYGYDIITVTGDVGNENDFTFVKNKALKVGAIKSYVVDCKEGFIKDYCFEALKADALYENTYPLATALNRPLIAKALVDIAKKEGATAIAHGCTGKGNDQVRFEVCTKALAPDLKVYAPAREWGMTREELIKYAAANDIPVPVKSGSDYSIDDSLWGRAIECGVLENPWNEPPADVYQWTSSPDKWPDQPEYVEIDFERGIPVAINGKAYDPVELVIELNQIAGRHGVGRIDHIENRLVGIKSREVYESPAGCLLIQAHIALEELCMSKDQLRFKHYVATQYADLIYNALWFSAHREDLAAYVDHTQRFITGTIRVKLYKGSAVVVGRKSPYSLYNYKLATYDEGDEFDQSSAPGFIQLWGLPVKIQSQLQNDRLGK
jgi:argininosuccinate synthase